MSLLNDIPLTALQFYITEKYPCSYLPGLAARSMVATPTFLINTAVYSGLVQHGFRRSGTHTYKPHCDGCRACIPLRVEAENFMPNRSQRRAWARHAGLEVNLLKLQDKDEYYQLYLRYQKHRHQNGGMDEDDRDAYQNFLLQSQVDTMLVEFREQGVLRMVSVIDILDDGISSVYTFYEPDMPQSSFGVYNVLWQIQLCRKLDLKFVYLGYWVQQCRKMNYKNAYQPAQGLINGVWRTLEGNI